MNSNCFSMEMHSGECCLVDYKGAGVSRAAGGGVEGRLWNSHGCKVAARLSLVGLLLLCVARLRCGAGKEEKWRQGEEKEEQRRALVRGQREDDDELVPRQTARGNKRVGARQGRL